MPNTVDPTICPLCGKSNACANQSQTNSSCWCADETIEFPPELLLTLPKEAQGKACICKECVSAFIATKLSTESN